MPRIAVASTEMGSNKVVSPGHFAHSPIFTIYDVENGKPKLVGSRKNPLSAVPDLDADEQDSHHHHHHHHPHLHGPPKYRFLRENVLSDVDVVVAGGACPTSVAVFTGYGVKIIFTEPGTPVEEAVAIVSRQKEIPEVGFVEGGDVKPV